jgi:hypothetical protein
VTADVALQPEVGLGVALGFGDAVGLGVALGFGAGRQITFAAGR